jgi:hypothetical protein
MPYPHSDLDSGPTIASLLGSFWSSTYGGASELVAYCEALGRELSSGYESLLESAAAVSVDTIRPFAVEEWHSITIARSVVEPGVGTVATFGDPNTFGPGGIEYGQPTGPVVYRVSVPGIVDVPWIFNRLASPSLSLGKGLDYTVEPASGGVSLVLQADPFADPRWPQRPVFDAAGNNTDFEIEFWLFRPLFDLNTVTDRYGSVLGIELPSSEQAKTLVIAAWNALVQGSSVQRISQLLAGATGVPAANGNETVQAVGIDDRGLHVLTDQAAYLLPAVTNPLVVVGDVLVEGQPLCDAWTLIEPQQGTLPAGITELALDAGLLAPDFVADIVVSAGSTPLIVTSDPRGITRVSWALGGFPADVTAFWNAVHAAGTAPGSTTLARLLDVRGPNAPTEPTAASLPPTIDPLAFLAANFLRTNFAVVTVRADGVLPGAPGLGWLRLLREFTSPHTALVILVSLPTLVEPPLGVTAESLASYTAASPVTDTLTPLVSGDGPPTARLIGGSCR